MPVEDDSIELGSEDHTYLREEAEKEREDQPLLCRMAKTDDYLRDLDRLKEDALKELWMSTSS
jgi:hypothetical protein